VKVYILIVNYNSWEYSLELLESISNSTNKSYQLVIVDNCSTDDSYHQLESSEYKFELLQTDKNGGFAYANNHFLQQIVEEDAYVWLLNPDTIVEKGALDILLQAIEKREKYIYTTSIYGIGEKSNQRRSGLCKINKSLGLTSHITKPKDISNADYVYGASFFCHSSAFKEVGLFPIHYFLYWEETEWCLLAKRQAYSFKWVEEAVIYDKVSSHSQEKQFVSEYYYSFNALRFFKKHYPYHLPFVLCANVLRYWYRKIKGSRNRSKAIVKATTDFLKKKPIPLPTQIS